MRNNHTKWFAKNKKTALSITAALSIIIVIALLMAFILIPRSNGPKPSSGGSAKTGSSTSTSYDSTMPKDAATSATKWFVSILKSYNGSIKDGYLTTNDAANELANMANGDYSKVPSSIKNAFYWSDDTKTSGKTVDEKTLKAAGYTAIMSAWQLRTSALKENSDLTYNSKLAYVDRDHGTVLIPAEAWCGLPAELIIQVDWTGKEWKIDGASSATQVTTKVRSAQLQSIEGSSDSSSSSSGN